MLRPLINYMYDIAEVTAEVFCGSDRGSVRKCGSSPVTCCFDWRKSRGSVCGSVCGSSRKLPCNPLISLSAEVRKSLYYRMVAAASLRLRPLRLPPIGNSIGLSFPISLFGNGSGLVQLRMLGDVR